MRLTVSSAWHSTVRSGMRLYTETGLKVPEASAYQCRCVVRYCTHITLSGLKNQQQDLHGLCGSSPSLSLMAGGSKRARYLWDDSLNSAWPSVMNWQQRLRLAYQVGHLEGRKSNEAVLSYLLKVSRVSICIVMEIEFLLSQKPANVTAKSLKNGGREGFRGFFPL